MLSRNSARDSERHSIGKVPAEGHRLLRALAAHADRPHARVSGSKWGFLSGLTVAVFTVFCNNHRVSKHCGLGAMVVNKAINEVGFTFAGCGSGWHRTSVHGRMLSLFCRARPGCLLSLAGLGGRAQCAGVALPLSACLRLKPLLHFPESRL